MLRGATYALPLAVHACCGWGLFACQGAAPSEAPGPPADVPAAAPVVSQAPTHSAAPEQPQTVRDRADIEAALAFLAASRQQSGGVFDARDRVWAAWESVQSASAHRLWPDVGDAALVRGVITFLDQSAKEHPRGMLYHSGGVPNRYCTETSSEYIRLLAGGTAMDRARARKAARWLASQQQHNGAWLAGYQPPAGGPADFPSVTAFVVSALHAADVPIPRPTAVRAFLEGAQHPDGHFGVLWHVYGTSHYALARVLQALRLLGADLDTPSVQAARSYLQKAQRPDGSWWELLSGHSEDSYTSPELHTALALQACVWAGMPPDDPVIRRGRKWLVSRQQADGSWAGGSFPFEGPSALTSDGQPRVKHEHLFTTVQALTALRMTEIGSPVPHE